MRLMCLDRAAIDPTLEAEVYFQALAREVERLAAGGRVTLIGFSLGAFVALRTAACMTAPPIAIHLVSAAAPLESGDFLDGMAGQAVFRMAVQRPALFRRMTGVQGWLAAHAPRLLFNMLFAGAAGADRDLARAPSFRAGIAPVLRRALGPDRAGYLRDVAAYVTPWAQRLSAISAPTSIWHGSADTWSPPAMAACLADLIPGASAPRIFPGLSHYSCLFSAAPEIFAGISRPERHVIRLQPATEADYPSVIALTNRAYREPAGQTGWKVEALLRGQRIDEALLRDDLATPGAHLLIARDEAGAHLGHVRLDSSHDGVWYLAMLSVSPDRQDAGLGTQVLAAAEDHARAAGARRIRMSVIHQRDELIAWYQRRGYVLTGETAPFPYGDARFGTPTRDDLFFEMLEKSL